jgi:predicted DNA-binding transcriptional regulator AlpA
LPERTQERRRYEGTGPKFVKAGRRVLYKRSDIEDWFAANTFSSTSEAAERGQ